MQAQLKRAPLFIKIGINFWAGEPKVVAWCRYLQRRAKRVLKAAKRKQIVCLELARLNGLVHPLKVFAQFSRLLRGADNANLDGRREVACAESIVKRLIVDDSSHWMRV